jgi:hypothetical protein
MVQMTENVMTQGRTLTSGGGNFFQGTSNFGKATGAVAEAYTPIAASWIVTNPGHSWSSSGPYAPLHAAMNTWEYS